MFPVMSPSGKMGEPAESVPWLVVERHRQQAKRNHYQTLERLAERGGLCPSELLAVLSDEGFEPCFLRLTRDVLGRAVTYLDDAEQGRAVAQEAWRRCSALIGRKHRGDDHG